MKRVKIGASACLVAALSGLYLVLARPVTPSIPIRPQLVAQNVKASEPDDPEEGQSLAFLDSDPMWTKNGDVVFTSSRIKDSDQSAYDREAIFKLDKAGTLSSLLTRVDALSSPSLSPDGKRLAFNAGEGFVAIVDLSNATVGLCSNSERLGLFSPSWDASGKRLVMVGQNAVEDDSPYLIYMADVANTLGKRSLSGRQAVYTSKVQPRLITFSPDEKSVVYAAEKMDSPNSHESRWTLFQLPLSGKSNTKAPLSHKLVDLPRQPERLSWFPDGKQIIVSYFPLSVEMGFQPQIVQVKKRTLAPFRLVLPHDPARLNLGKPFSIALDATGTRIAFTAIIPNKQKKGMARGCLFQCRLNGAELKQLTSNTNQTAKVTHYARESLTSLNLWQKSLEKLEQPTSD